MKKLVLAALIISMGAVRAKETRIASIDTAVVLQKSKAGKALLRAQESAREEFQKTLTSKQKEVAELKQKLQDKVQSGAIAEDAFRSQLASIELKERRSEFEVQEKSTQLQNKLKEQENQLRKDIAVTAQELVKAEGYSMVVTKDAPFVLASHDDIDETSALLKKCDEKYEAEVAKSALSKSEKKA